ncbi:MAG: hypothetical protein GF419_12100, partial [Ignavibacteriales bacterium]|nr:hypothetical protein [Ignavibacteriales bacterium]
MRVSTATTKRLAYLAVWLALAATAFWALTASDFFAPSAERRIVKPSDVQRYEKGYVSDRQRAFDVLEYRLELDVFPRVGALRGTARITGEATAALAAIDLNFEDSMAVRACRVNGAPTGFSKSGSRLSLAARLEAGERAAIEIEYLGFPTPRGFGSFVVRKWRGSWILSTLNEP